MLTEMLGFCCDEDVVRNASNPFHCLIQRLWGITQTGERARVLQILAYAHFKSTGFKERRWNGSIGPEHSEVAYLTLSEEAGGC